MIEVILAYPRMVTPVWTRLPISQTGVGQIEIGKIAVTRFAFPPILEPVVVLLVLRILGVIVVILILSVMPRATRSAARAIVLVFGMSGRWRILAIAQSFIAVGTVGFTEVDLERVVGNGG